MRDLMRFKLEGTYKLDIHPAAAPEKASRFMTSVARSEKANQPFNLLVFQLAY